MRYRHHPDTAIVLEDLYNRVQQFIEANNSYHREHLNLVEQQNVAFRSVLTIIDQAKRTGHVARGSSFVPDPIEAVVTTKWDNRPQLGVSDE